VIYHLQVVVITDAITDLAQSCLSFYFPYVEETMVYSEVAWVTKATMAVVVIAA